MSVASFEAETHWFNRCMQLHDEYKALCAEYWEVKNELEEYKARERREQEELDAWCDEHEAEFLMQHEQHAHEQHAHAQGMCD